MTEPVLPVWVSYLEALSTPAIALAGLLIAYGQWRVAAAKLRADLYERRFRVFETVRGFVQRAAGGRGVTMSDVAQFSAATVDAAFLFDPSVTAYRERIVQEAATLATVGDALTAPDRATGPEDWLSEQIYGDGQPLAQVFFPFLAVDRAGVSGEPARRPNLPFSSGAMRRWR